MTRILLTAAGGSAAFNFRDALSLSKNAYSFVGTDLKPYHIELNQLESRYYVPPVTDPRYIEIINKIVDKEKIDFIHPQPDIEVAILTANKDKLKAKIFLPPTEEVVLCHDKMRFNESLQAAGVSVPKAFAISSKENLGQAIAELSKIQKKVWLRATHGAGSRASLPVTNAYQADGWIDYWREVRGLDYKDFMASEFLPGAEFAWQSLWYNGELITAQARERVEYIFGNLTPSGQTSSPSVARTVNRDDINKIGQDAVRAISSNPHGVYCVDMKADASDIPKVTEINIGRFFTTSNFFAHAGLNMPEMYIELAMKGSLKKKPKQLNPLEENLYWVRMIDMGFKLVRDEQWSTQKI